MVRNVHRYRRHGDHPGGTVSVDDPASWLRRNLINPPAIDPGKPTPTPHGGSTADKVSRRADVLAGKGATGKVGLPPDDRGRADSNGDSNVGSQPPPLTHDSIQPRSGLIT
jgi:hypothetical protein